MCRRPRCGRNTREASENSAGHNSAVLDQDDILSVQLDGTNHAGPLHRVRIGGAQEGGRAVPELDGDRLLGQIFKIVRHHIGVSLGKGAGLSPHPWVGLD